MRGAAEKNVESIARRAGRCAGCDRRVAPGEAIVKAAGGWMHASCGAGYRRVFAEHEER